MRLFGRPDAAEEHFKEGLLFRDLKRKEFDVNRAVGHFKEAVKLRPDNYKYHFELGRTYLLIPEWAVFRQVLVPFKLPDFVKMALAEFEEVVRLNPKYDPAYLNIAHCYVILGEKARAVDYYEQYLRTAGQKVELVAEQLQNLEYVLLKRRRSNPDARPAEAEQHLRQAVQFRGFGNYRDAEKEFEKAREIAPDYNWLYNFIYKVAG